jgi:hypothetical protein
MSKLLAASVAQIYSQMLACFAFEKGQKLKIQENRTLCASQLRHYTNFTSLCFALLLRLRMPPAGTRRP